MKKTVTDLLKEQGYFYVWGGDIVGGKEIDRYEVDGIEYIQIEYNNSPGKVYTYVVQ